MEGFAVGHGHRVMSSGGLLPLVVDNAKSSSLAKEKGYSGTTETFYQRLI